SSAPSPGGGYLSTQIAHSIRVDLPNLSIFSSPRAGAGMSWIRPGRSVMLMLMVVVDVVEVDLRFAHGVPRVPGDLQDHERDREADYRVGDLRAERDDDRARNNPERDEAVDASVVAVGDHCRTR